MGLRGPHANVGANPHRPPDELVITDAALRIYRRMRRLECQCTCPDENEPDLSLDSCPACAECLRLNRKLCGCFGLPEWEFAYMDPDGASRRRDQWAVDRFHALERAAAKAKKKPKYKYKWER